MNLRPIVLAALLCPLFASAQLTFVFDYSTNPSGVGFLDPTVGATRQAWLDQAGRDFSQMFGSHFSNSGTITLTVTSRDAGATGSLAAAGSSLLGFSSGHAGFSLTDVIRTKLVTGVDKNGAANDGTLNVNWGYAWSYDGTTAHTYDFLATLSHELTHSLGFFSTIKQNGSDVWGNLSPTAGQWDQFDRFVADKNGNSIINSSGLLNQSAWNTYSVGGYSGGENGLTFNGPNAEAANGGQPVGIYSPTTWASGSSGSHVDTLNPLYNGLMMAHAAPTGVRPTDYSAVEIGIMLDLGYTAVTAVPEPATYALMLGCLTAFLVLWRRRRI